MKIYLKKMFLFLFLLVVITSKCQLVVAQRAEIIKNRNFSEQLDLTQNNNSIASNILKKVYCNQYYENNSSCSIGENLFKAQFRDFDNDGVNEIIGLYDDGQNRTVYILKKEKEVYVIVHEIDNSVITSSNPVVNVKFLEKEASITFIIKSFDRTYNGESEILDFWDLYNDKVAKIAKKMLIAEEVEPLNKIMYKKASIIAFYKDLDGDGIDEILGDIQSTHFAGSKEHAFFILKKNGKKYKQVAFQLFFPFRGVKLTKVANKSYLEFNALQFVDTNIDYENRFIYEYMDGSYSEIGAEKDLVIQYR